MKSFVNINFLNTGISQDLMQILSGVSIILPNECIFPIGRLFSKIKTEVFLYDFADHSNLLSEKFCLFNDTKTLHSDKIFSGYTFSNIKSKQFLITVKHGFLKNDYTVVPFQYVKQYLDQTNFTFLIHKSFGINRSSNLIYNKNDIRIYKVKNKSLKSNIPIIYLADSYQIKEKVFYLGYPFGSPLKIVEGEIVRIDNGFIETSCPSFEGSSGSPLFNKDCKLIGIMKSSVSGTEFDSDGKTCYSFGNSFAIPIFKALKKFI